MLCLSIQLKLVTPHTLNLNTYACGVCVCVYVLASVCCVCATGIIRQCLLFTVLLVAPGLEKTEALKTLCFGERQNSAVF